MKFLNMSSIHLYIIIVLTSFFSLAVYGQEKNDTIYKDSISNRMDDWFLTKIENDTMQIALDDIWLLPRMHFESEEARREYLITRRRVYKVYPFATLAADRLETVNDLLETLPNKQSRKTYLRRAQKFMREEFEDTLKNFTRSEGRILFKLIHRQTGYTTYELVKEYRSGWNAFWYNTAASVYDLTMKQKYDPYNEKEDYYIEDILQRAYGNGRLEEQEPAIPINLREIYESWH